MVGINIMKKFVSIFLFLFLCIAGVSSVNAATVQKRWANPKHLNTYIQPGLERSTMMEHAFAEWSRLTKNKVVFYYVDSPKDADIEVIFVDRVPGNMQNATGLTNCLYSAKHEMIHAKILIPAKSTAGRTLSRDDVYTSMLHEIGHAIGIVVHSTNPNNIMYPLIDAKREITKYDLAELYRIYGWQ